ARAHPGGARATGSSSRTRPWGCRRSAGRCASGPSGSWEDSSPNGHRLQAREFLPEGLDVPLHGLVPGEEFLGLLAVDVDRGIRETRLHVLQFGLKGLEFLG